MADDPTKEGEIPSLDDFWSTGGEEAKPEGGGAAAPAEGAAAAAPPGDVKMDAGWDSMMQEVSGSEAKPAGAAPVSDRQVQAKTFATIEASGGGLGEPRNLEIILDIPLEVTAELGKARVMVQDFLRLGLGSIVELQKLAGEPVEVMVNGTLVARGEVVVVNEKFGVRLTDIISQAERVKKLV
ncbi:MAG: flagellar motor switch protein FliN [Nitrospirae bacterium]|nr:flagellar motor switch protein FliN [Nitrospirota bacterium]